VTVLVKDYDQALAWYTGVLGLAKVEDRNFGPARRWLVVAPAGKSQLGIVLEVPNADGSRADRIGKETNWVFEVADCVKFYDSLRAHGVHFTDPPKSQPWGTTQAVFEDPYGNIFVAESQSLAKTADRPDRR
jgi:catechol 2,3-dioxygenase-like lactoylglutathione lyase family enzyme